MKRALLLLCAALAISCRRDSGVDLEGAPLYSQHKEELIIRDFFRDRRDGFFLDVGCATPIRDSNTHYLEKHVGWSGIGVDGLPEYRSSWERRRPKSKFFNYLVTDHADTVDSIAPSFRGSPRANRP